MEIFDLDKLSLFILFFVPGFISIKVWSLIVPTQSRKMNDYLLDAIVYSCINFALSSGVIIFIVRDSFQVNHPFWFLIFIILILFILPIIWPILFTLCLNSNLFNRFSMHPSPTAWDYHFKKGAQQYVIIHLKNGHLIGGLWGFSSSYPNPEDIYLSETWKVNQEGEFLECIDETNGLWIGKDNIEYMEFFNAQPIEKEGEVDEK